MESKPRPTANQITEVVQGRAVTSGKTGETSLIARGLTAIRQNQTALLQSTDDTRYRQARDRYNRTLYNRITGYGTMEDIRAEYITTNTRKQFNELFAVFYELVNKGYEKAHFALASMYYFTMGTTAENFDQAKSHGCLALNWFSSHQTLQDLEIWTDVGWFYERGIGIPKDYEQAYVWYCKAAERSFPHAQYNLGKLYYGGHGVKRDSEEAIFWYRKAAEQNDPCAQWRLGLIYRYRREVEEDCKRAVFWFRKAAEQGHIEAQSKLGDMYRNGDGVEIDVRQAVFWRGKAAEQGHSGAQYMLPPAQFCLACEYERDQDYENAFFWHQKAAEQDYISSQYFLAKMYFDGQGTKQDYEKARIWYSKVAQGFASSEWDLDAKFKLGFIYEHGLGVEKSDQQAQYWYKKAAAKGEPRALERLKELGIDWTK